MKISYYLPKTALDNTQLKSSGWNMQRIFEKTGIRQRHVSAKNQYAMDLALGACRTLLREHRISKDRVDFLLYCTQSPDFIIPTNACLLQHKLGLNKTIGALDFNLGCSGFVYGLSLAKGLLATGQARSVLLVTADTYTKYIHKDDRVNRTLFGDGAAATYLDKADAQKIGHFIFGTDGSGADNLCVKTSGLRYGPSKTEGHAFNRDNHLYMDGPSILNFALSEVPAAVAQTLRRSKMKIKDIDYFVFHQANAFMLEALREKIDIPKEKMLISLEDIGNTVSSSIPIALSRFLKNGKIRTGQKLLLVGFGVGYSWVATVIRA